MILKNNYAIELSKAILDLEIIKNEAIIERSPNPRMCYCKAIILDNYLTACQLLYIRVTSRVIKYIDELYRGNIDISNFTNQEIFDFKDLKQWFKYYAYDGLFKYEKLSKKMLIIFKKIQSLIDRAFFDYFESEYKEFINHIIEELHKIDEEIIYESLKELYINMRNWFETSVFNILGLNFNCKNIKDNIFTNCKLEVNNINFCFEEELKKNKCEVKEISSNYDYLKFCESEFCVSHRFIEDNKEFIHLIVLPEMLIYNGSWFFNYIKLFQKYHINSKAIDIFIDYKLIESDEYNWDMDTLKRFSLLFEVFDNVYVINHEHIDKSMILDVVKDRIIFDDVPDYFKKSMQF